MTINSKQILNWIYGWEYETSNHIPNVIINYNYDHCSYIKKNTMKSTHNKSTSL